MKINKVDENKIICILSKEETQLYEIDNEFNIENEYNRLFIIDALTEVGCLEQLEESDLYIEMIKSGFGSTKIKINFMSEEELNEKIKQNPSIKENLSSGVFDLENNSIREFDEDEDFDDEDDEDFDFDDDFEFEDEKNELAVIDNNTNNKHKIFVFANLDDVINASQIVRFGKNIGSSLYKNVITNEFYLIISNLDDTNKFNYMLETLGEFSKGIIENNFKNIKEHHKCIIKTNALYNLSRF